MAYVATTDGEFPSGPSRSSFGKIAMIVAALAIASGTAAWIAGFDSIASVLGVGSPMTRDTSSFNDRFLPISRAPSVNVSPRLLVQAWSSELELKLHQAKTRLAQRLQSQDSAQQGLAQQDAAQQDASPVQTAVVDDPKPAIATAIPLPRSRPVEAKLETQSVPAPANATAVAARPEDRTLLQKLSDLLPSGGIKLASLGPDGGLLSGGPDLGALGYDKLTAVYDISAHAVYLPNGSKLEAHSGIGRLMDDPEHVSERMVGATPPAVYDLRPRERLFHGVEALRMIPEDNSATLGRSGLLTHSYMLGPNGDSNGCVSIRDYDRFLSAYKSGEISRLVVVPHLNAAAPDTRRADSQT